MSPQHTCCGAWRGAHLSTRVCRRSSSDPDSNRSQSTSFPDYVLCRCLATCGTESIPRSGIAASSAMLQSNGKPRKARAMTGKMLRMSMARAAGVLEKGRSETGLQRVGVGCGWRTMPTNACVCLDGGGREQGSCADMCGTLPLAMLLHPLSFPLPRSS